VCSALSEKIEMRYKFVKRSDQEFLTVKDDHQTSSLLSVSSDTGQYVKEEEGNPAHLVQAAGESVKGYSTG